MMEPVTTSTMHISENKTICSTLTCTKNENDEISKKLEDELLYGVDDEDADEEDALSDDSLRLRLSDDEIDGDMNDIANSCPINNQLKSIKTEFPDTGSDVEASGSSFDPENLNNMHKLMKNEINDNKDTIIKFNLTNNNNNNNNNNIKSNFYNNDQQNQLLNKCIMNKDSLNLNDDNFYSKNLLSKYNLDNISKSYYGCVYYNNPYNFGRSRKNKNGTFNHNNLNGWSLKSEHSSRNYSSIITKSSINPITTKPNVSADDDLDTSKSEEYSNGIKIDKAEKNHQDNESNFNNNNFPKTKIEEPDVNTEPNSPVEDTSVIDDSLAEPENLDETKTCDDGDTQNEDDVIDKIDVHDENKPPISTDPVNIENVEEDKETDETEEAEEGEEEQEEDEEEEEEEEEEEITEIEIEESVEAEKEGEEEKEDEKKDDEVEVENSCVINESIQNDSNIDIDDTKIDVNPPSDNVKENLHDDDDVDNAKDLLNASSNIEKDDNEIKIDNEQPKVINKDILKQEPVNNDKNDDNVCDDNNDNNDDIASIQDAPSETIDVIEKSNNKRRLSESDEETNVCKKVLCEEKIEKSLKPEIMPENVNVKICQGPDGIPEFNKILEAEGKKTPDVDTLRNDYINGDSCSAELETVTMSMETTVEDESCQKDEYIEKTSEVDKSHEESARSKRRRKRRKTSSPSNVINQIQEKENVRQRRETAQKAQEMIRKLNNDSDSDTEDSIIKVAYKGRTSYTNIQPLSPPSLKRNIFENEESLDGLTKKPKNDVINKYADTIDLVASGNKKTLEHVRKFFLRDSKQQLAKLTQEQLEELLIQKVIETITMRDEIGKLREQARISERNQEATRVKCQQLAKQIKDFEMVLTRFAADRRANEKTATPIKINRSVGLQVSFITDVGIQNLRQLNNAKSNTIPNGLNTPPKSNDESLNNSLNGRKGIKVRSPRRPEISVPSLTTPTSSVSSIPYTLNTPVSQQQQQQPPPPPPPPRTLVVSKSIDNRQTVITTAAPPMPNQSLVQTITLNGIQIQPNNVNHQTKVLNVRSNDNINNSINNDNSNNISNTINTSGIIGNSNNNSNINIIGNNNNNANLIDLTGEEEKNKFVLTDPPPLSTIPVPSKDISPAQKTSPRYQRIVQPAPPNVTIPPSAVRVIQPADKPTSAALVNNMNASRLTLVMKGQHQLLIANPNQIRPVLNATPRPAFSGITYAGLQTLPNGAVRVVPTANASPAQKPKHPAALPAVTNYPLNPVLKLPPPAPSLKISKVPNGIVLSWNMALSDRYADIASYQLYAYQEVTGMAPSTSLWRKVGDVRALALPMACTLTQFTEGNNYYFAVRAVDRHSRFGQYSQPGSISL